MLFIMINLEFFVDVDFFKVFVIGDLKIVLIMVDVFKVEGKFWVVIMWERDEIVCLELKFFDFLF